MSFKNWIQYIFILKVHSSSNCQASKKIVNGNGHSEMLSVFLQQRDKNYYFHVIGDKTSSEMLTTLEQRNQSYSQE